MGARLAKLGQSEKRAVGDTQDGRRRESMQIPYFHVPGNERRLEKARTHVRKTGCLEDFLQFVRAIGEKMAVAVGAELHVLPILRIAQFAVTRKVVLEVMPIGRSRYQSPSGSEQFPEASKQFRRVHQMFDE